MTLEKHYIKIENMMHSAPFVQFIGASVKGTVKRRGAYHFLMLTSIIKFLELRSPKTCSVSNENVGELLIIIESLL